MRLIVFCFLLIISFWCTTAYAQHDSLPAKKDANLNTAGNKYNALPDSATTTKENREQFIADSIAMYWLKPDSLRKTKFLSTLPVSNFGNIDSLLNNHSKSHGVLPTGRVRLYRDPWLIATIVGLLLYTALLNLFLGKEIKNVIQSFYNKHAVSQVDKEGGLINSWAFIGLFVLFSLASGLVLYQFTIYRGYSYQVTGFQLFIALSVLISLLFALKFFVLKFIGFVFDINKIVSEYIAILNLTYFNIAFVLLSVTICFSLLSDRYIPGLLTFTVTLIAIIFAWQYLRNSVNIISNIRFHKFYLFIYLCALEICPVLILIKALGR